MISDERQFRRYYNDKRKQDRDRDSFRDRNNKDFSADRYDREYDYSTGYNHSRDYGGHAYNSSRSQNGGIRYGGSRYGDSHYGSSRYDNRDYQYSYGDERDYDRYRDEDRSWNDRNEDQRRARSGDFRNNDHGNERDYRRMPGRNRGYQNYENPGLSDRYGDRSGGIEDRRQSRGERIQWDPEDVDRRNQYDVGMERYQARYRQEFLHGGRTEKQNLRNAHSGEDDNQGFFDRNRTRARAWYDEEMRNRNRDRDRTYPPRYERDRDRD